METWQRILLIVVGILVGLFVLALLGLSIWSLRAEKSPTNQAFKNGTFPEPPLDGQYKGAFSREISWQGKKLDAQNATGINVFMGNKEQYAFKTYPAKSLKSGQKVLKIDYDIPKNPLWLHFIVDELVQVTPNKYQGKVFAKFGPLSFTLTYFELEQ